MTTHLFAYDDFYPGGADQDYRGAFESVEEALATIIRANKEYKEYEEAKFVRKENVEYNVFWNMACMDNYMIASEDDVGRLIFRRVIIEDGKARVE